MDREREREILNNAIQYSSLEAGECIRLSILVRWNKDSSLVRYYCMILFHALFYPIVIKWMATACDNHAHMAIPMILKCFPLVNVTLIINLSRTNALLSATVCVFISS